MYISAGFVVCVACGEPLPGGSTICSCGEVAFDEPLPSSHHLAPLRKDYPFAGELVTAQATPRDALTEADALLDAFAPPRRGAGGAGGIPQIAAGHWGDGGQSIGPTPRMDGGFMAAGAGSLGPTPRMDGGFAKGFLDHAGPTPRMEAGFFGKRVVSTPVEDIGGPTPRIGDTGTDAAEGTPRMTMAAHVAQQRLRASNAPPAPMLGDYLADQLEAAGGKPATVQNKGTTVAGATGPGAAGAGQGRALRLAQVRSKADDCGMSKIQDICFRFRGARAAFQSQGFMMVHVCNHQKRWM